MMASEHTLVITLMAGRPVRFECGGETVTATLVRRKGAGQATIRFEAPYRVTINRGARTVRADPPAPGLPVAPHTAADLRPVRRRTGP